jgi:hypothetical protein
MHADSRPGPGIQPVASAFGLTFADPKRFPLVTKPMCHRVIVVAHLAVDFAFSLEGNSMLISGA